MIVENGKIIEATRTEIYSFWLAGEWEEIITFPDFLRAMEQAGAKIVEEGNHAGGPMLTDRQCEVINALAFANMNKVKAAKMLGCHYQNVYHHLAVIKERTGKDPNDFFDLHDLYKMAGGAE